MNKDAIRRPIGPAIIFLINSITYLNTMLMPTLLSLITGNVQEMPALALFRLTLWLVTALFFSIVLFSKKYNIMPIAAIVISVPSIVSLFFGINIYRIADLLFFILFTVFTFIMVKMPEATTREKAVKLRFIFPAFQFVSILASTIPTIKSLFENFTETTGTQLSDPMNIVAIIIPSIISAIISFLPVLCYAWLANWLADPYKK